MSTETVPKITYISWAPHCSRSDHTARELGGSSHMVYWARLGSHPATIWLKYLGQAISTWRVLIREAPDATFVMSPSPVAGLVVYLYCLVARTPFVIDAHSGAFRNPKWRMLRGLQYWLCRRARATIVTNEHLASLVTNRGGAAVIVPDVPVRFSSVEPPPPGNGFTVACVTSFGHDEPIAAIFESARRLPDVTFYMTGNPKGASHALNEKPGNVILTGFLDVPRYAGLLQSAGVVMALTTEDHTMLRGAYEAIYQGTPIIISDSALLRTAFNEGALHVDNTPDGIVEAVLQMRRDREHYKHGSLRLRTLKEQQWAASKIALLAAIRNGRLDTSPPA